MKLRLPRDFGRNQRPRKRVRNYQWFPFAGPILPAAQLACQKYQ
jgi:hypothetical protein